MEERAMAMMHWTELSPRTRRVIVSVAVVDALLKTAAVVDLLRSRPEQVRGSRIAWLGAIVLTNSVGVMPIAYFVYGRRSA